MSVSPRRKITLLLCAAYTALGTLCTNVHGNVKVLLTGIVAVSRVDDAEHVVGGCLLLNVHVLVDEPSSAAPLPQFREHFSLQNTHKCVKVYKGLFPLSTNIRSSVVMSVTYF